MIDPKHKDAIVKELNNKVGNFICPICHKGPFTLVDGYFVQSSQNDYKNFIIGSDTIIPSVIIVCNNCGFMSQHSLGVLGLIEKSQTK